MKTLKNIDIPKEIQGKSLYLYGAGYTARICLKVLKNAGFGIKALIDDDILKQGTLVDSYTVLSYEEFVDKCKKEGEVYVILTSIYGKQIYNRLSSISNVVICEMYEWYMEILDAQGISCEKSLDDVELEGYKRNTDMLKPYLKDEESRSVYDGIYQYFKTNKIQYLVDICTEEETYFIHEVKEYFRDRRINLVDVGAYEGELLRAIISSSINVKTWFCFELEKDNFERLKENIKKNPLSDSMNCIIENLGLWNQKKRMQVLNQGTASKVSEQAQAEEMFDGREAETCEMETIDNYFRNIKVDMIKMDIEGAEMQALEGGIHTIKRDRPLLAISIYHYVKDYYRIMQFLMDNLDEYSYYIRQHALIYGETILYAIPQ